MDLVASQRLPGSNHDEGREYVLHLDENGRSALDMARVPECTREKLREMVKHELKRDSNNRTIYVSSLTRAAQEGDIAAVRRLVDAAGDILDAVDWGLLSAVAGAAGRGHYHVVRLLLESERSKMATSSYTTNRLETAVQSWNHEEADQLNKFRLATFNQPINKMVALRAAAGFGSLEIVRLLVDHGAQLRADSRVEPRTGNDTALEHASWNGHLEIVRFLLDCGATVEPRPETSSALRLASGQGHLEVVECLLKAGARLHNDGSLHLAASGGHCQVVNRLLESGLDVDLYARSGQREPEQTALQGAALGGHLDVIQALLQAGADPNAPRKFYGRSALLAAIQSGSLDVVKELIKAGAKIYDSKSYSAREAPMVMAAECGFMEVVDLFLKLRPERKDEDPELDARIAEECRIAARRATERGHTSALDRLLQDEYDPGQHLGLQREVIRAAILKGEEKVVRQILESHTNAPDLDSSPGLVSSAAERGISSIVKLLLDAGVKVDGVGPEDTQGFAAPYNKALENALRLDHTETLNLLLSHGADANAKFKNGEYPLHLACRRSNPKMARLLLDAGARTDAVSDSGKTIWQSAKDGESAEILEMLVIRDPQLKSPPDDEGDPMNSSLELKRSEQGISSLVGSDSDKGVLCSVCSALVAKYPDLPQQGSIVYESLRSLEERAGKGCIFCMFLSRQFHKRPMARVLSDSLHWSRVGELGYMVYQRDLPYQGDTAKVLPPAFHLCDEPSHCEKSLLMSGMDSQGTFEQIRSWLDQCDKDRPPCKSEVSGVFMPTRLIDLSHWRDKASLKIIESKTMQTHAVPYVTLSHRWNGRVTEASSTTSKNINQRLASLEPESLPIVFLHTIEAAQRLGIDYVWIDSLCIIQDDRDDWDFEGSKMCDIYQYSYCTISAESPDTGVFGLFGDGKGRYDVEFPFVREDGQRRTAHAVTQASSWGRLLNDAILEKRGWCLQERQLSSRILHFGQFQVAWECRELRATEQEPTTEPYESQEHMLAPRRIMDFLNKSSVSDAYTLWHRLVEDFSSRQLTKHEDALPALAGLARAVHRHVRSDYVAGLWAGNLLESLVWHISSISTTFDFALSHLEPPLKRKENYVAPSWSWASVSAKVEFPRPQYPGISQFTTTITNYNVRLATPDPFSRVTSVELSMTGQIMNAVADTELSTRDILYFPPYETWHKEGQGYIEFDTREDAERLKVVSVVCLYRLEEDTPRVSNIYWHGLALAPVAGEKDAYVRVGKVEGTSASIFDGVEKTSFILR